MILFTTDYTMLDTNNYKKIFVAGNKLVFESFNDRQTLTCEDEEQAKFFFEGMKAAIKRGDEFFDCEVPF